MDGEYPNQKWAEIDGKEYYYNPGFYRSIDILQSLNGKWEIIVTTHDAYYKGTSVYNLLNIGLLSLPIIDLAICAIWYCVKAKNIKRYKQKTSFEGVGFLRTVLQ